MSELDTEAIARRAKSYALMRHHVLSLAALLEAMPTDAIAHDRIMGHYEKACIQLEDMRYTETCTKEA